MRPAILLALWVVRQRLSHDYFDNGEQVPASMAPVATFIFLSPLLLNCRVGEEVSGSSETIDMVQPARVALASITLDGSSFDKVDAGKMHVSEVDRTASRKTHEVPFKFSMILAFRGIEDLANPRGFTVADKPQQPVAVQFRTVRIALLGRAQLFIQIDYRGTSRGNWGSLPAMWTCRAATFSCRAKCSQVRAARRYR